MTSTTRTLCYHSPTWMPFLDQLLAPLLQGGCCVFFPEVTMHVINPMELSVFASQKRVTHLGFVPTVLDIFVQDTLPRSLKAVGVGGAPVTTELLVRVAAAMQETGNDVLLTTGYSGTEQGDVTNIRMRSLEGVQDAAGHKLLMTAGRAHSGQRHAIVDRCMNLLGPGAIGEVMVSGPGLALGYFNLPHLTSEYFVSCKSLGSVRAARTGDLGRWTEDGQLELVGRLGSMVKVRGARIDLGEVEHAIGAHPQVKNCVVLVHDDRLVAYVEPAVPADLRDFCKARLVAYMVPHMFEGSEEIPRLTNGKVDKKRLKPSSVPEDGLEIVMDQDSLGQMRKFMRKDAAEDVILDNVRVVLMGVVIMSHAIPLTRNPFGAGKLEMKHGHHMGPDGDLHAEWTPLQFWILYVLFSGGWSSLAFLTGYDDSRAEHKGYALTYREVLFAVLWIVSGFHWAMWFLPTFVYMRIAFVGFSRVGLEYTHMIVISQIFITLPIFVDPYIGWKPTEEYDGMEKVCTCFCPFEAWQGAQTWADYLLGYWGYGPKASYLGHGLIFIPCYWIGLYSGKHIFPFLCKLSNEKRWFWRALVAAVVITIYVAMFRVYEGWKSAYDDRCSSFQNNGNFVWAQVLKNIRYYGSNLFMSLMYVVLIAALVPVHFKSLAKTCFPSYIFSPCLFCVLDLPVQALTLRSAFPSSISPCIELAWVLIIPYLYMLITGAALARILPAVFQIGLSAWKRFSKWFQHNGEMI
eukprot:gnl/TRDRNA2_/TRDRNA2_177787_c0_seq1.p1 gnl/TRDRNA2_/TRDRNA2_177787_c0~~gnl/TRDRNA2_/TRDRNA2_177787_c0_seq1.p1  ORF type:complete len:773 (+),score=92.85 gnl/TRDRNA2_/TRDRNA2_177787_c0_seq1:92-2320(+)